MQIEEYAWKVNKKLKDARCLSDYLVVAVQKVALLLSFPSPRWHQCRGKRLFGDKCSKLLELLFAGGFLMFVAVQWPSCFIRVAQSSGFFMRAKAGWMQEDRRCPRILFIDAL
jgi:hypothetical protein